MTQISVTGERLYLSPVMDLFNGEITAFETARRPTFKLAENIFAKALTMLTVGDKLILHSDQGWQYRINAYQLQLRR